MVSLTIPKGPRMLDLEIRRGLLIFHMNSYKKNKYGR